MDKGVDNHVDIHMQNMVNPNFGYKYPLYSRFLAFIKQVSDGSSYQIYILINWVLRSVFIYGLGGGF